MTGHVGTDTRRVEGRDKVTGAARYAFEAEVPGAAHAWPVQATIARGDVTAYGVEPVLALPGVLAVLTADNAPRLRAQADPELSVLQTRSVAYRGQVVALVVAETPQIARDAAARLAISYTARPHDVEWSLDSTDFLPSDRDGAADRQARHETELALASSPVGVDAVYRTPAEFPNPMEPHATTAQWEGDRLLLHDSTQTTRGVADDLAALFDVDHAAVRVVAEHVGGGFGAKGSTRPQAVLAALAARVTGRPVKLALTRRMQFSLTGYRTATIQRLRLGADADGRLTGISHESFESTSTVFDFAEEAATSSRHLYAAPARWTASRLVRRDVPTPRWMRAPGEAPGMFAIESAMDELAVAAGLDPVELRIRNDTRTDPDTGRPFSSRNLVACLRQGADEFGWSSRDPRPGLRRDGRWLLGTGVASATYPVYVAASGATATASQDGRYAVDVNAIDIGTGARTVLHQIAADSLGVAWDRVDLRLGDSAFPRASGAGGSSGTASWGWAVQKACARLRGRLIDGIPLGGLSVTVDTADDLAELADLARFAYGAQFAEVAVDTASGEVRVRRMLGVFAAGRILNPRTARSQFLGGMTMGLSMALHEEGQLDAGSGDFANSDFAGYHIATYADVPELSARWIEEDDADLNPLGGKGIGEIGIVGAAAAITNAIWHASGVRVRDLPATTDKLLAGLP